MCTTCKQQPTAGAPEPDGFTYSVAPHPGVTHLEYQGVSYNLDKLTCCQKRLLFGKTPFITRTPTTVETAVVASEGAPAEEKPTRSKRSS